MILWRRLCSKNRVMARVTKLGGPHDVLPFRLAYGPCHKLRVSLVRLVTVAL